MTDFITVFLILIILFYVGLLGTVLYRMSKRKNKNGTVIHISTARKRRGIK